MATTKGDFVKQCDVIVAAKPAYKLGCSSKTQCDCIGMVKYSMRQNHVTFSTTGTNYTFRNQLKNIRKITSVADLKFGDVVFKAKKPGDSGYNLPAKYRKGGASYNGDLTDYTHIGVVKSVNPLRIIHMTSPTAKTDTTIGRWAYSAELDERYISDAVQQPAKEPEPVISESKTAVVTAPSGRWVKMRQRPTTSCGMYDEIPIGATVTVISVLGDWTQISYGKRKGWYMMTKFLRFNNSVG